MKPRSIISDLIENYDLTEQRIADRITEAGVPVTQSTINRIKLGEIEQPKFDLGMAILQLWEKTKAAKTEAAA